LIENLESFSAITPSAVSVNFRQVFFRFALKAFAFSLMQNNTLFLQFWLRLQKILSSLYFLCGRLRHHILQWLNLIYQWYLLKAKIPA
jgi:hypothetical protein